LRSSQQTTPVVKKPQPLPVAKKPKTPAPKIPQSKKPAAPIFVTCVKCTIVREVPLKYMPRYHRDNWKEKFMCYKFKLRNVSCDHSIKPAAQDSKPVEKPAPKKREVKMKLKSAAKILKEVQPIFAITRDKQRKPQLQP
jgi:hypothetical protein